MSTYTKSACRHTYTKSACRHIFIFFFLLLRNNASKGSLYTATVTVLSYLPSYLPILEKKDIINSTDFKTKKHGLLNSN